MRRTIVDQLKTIFGSNDNSRSPAPEDP